MAHGITLAMRAIDAPAIRYIHEHPAAVKTKRGYVKPAGMTSHVNPEKDRSLAGKARIRARRQAVTA